MKTLQTLFDLREFLPTSYWNWPSRTVFSLYTIMRLSRDKSSYTSVAVVDEPIVRPRRTLYLVCISETLSLLYHRFRVRPPHEDDEYIDERRLLFTLLEEQFGHKVVQHKRHVTAYTKKVVAASYGWKCFECGENLPPTYQVDHHVELRDGGSNEIENLRPLCPNCHALKTNSRYIRRPEISCPSYR